MANIHGHYLCLNLEQVHEHTEYFIACRRLDNISKNPLLIFFLFFRTCTTSHWPQNGLNTDIALQRFFHFYFKRPRTFFWVCEAHLKILVSRRFNIAHAWRRSGSTTRNRLPMKRAPNRRSRLPMGSEACSFEFFLNFNALNYSSRNSSNGHLFCPREQSVHSLVSTALLRDPLWVYNGSNDN